MKKERLLNNRRKTTGRKRHYQQVNGSSILHIQQSVNQLLAQSALAKGALRIVRKAAASEATIAKRLERHRGVLIWNSFDQGTFYGNVKRDLINK
jgi:hypothetical protein